MAYSFEGRVAAVTGAGKGLGRAYALWLARHGCRVVVNNRTHSGIPSSARTLVDQIVAEGGKAAVHEGAIDEQAAAQGLVETAIEHFGKLDILICNAGVMPEGPFSDIDPEQIARCVSINVLGTIYPAQAAWRHMLTTGYGRIVLTGSTVGVYGHGGVAVYGATRAAVIGLARSLTLERPADMDIGINVVLPSAITDMSARSMGQGIEQAVIDNLAPGRVAPVVGWLCSEGCRQSGSIFHASALRAARVGLVESVPVVVDEESDLNEVLFSLEPICEPSQSMGTVGRLLGGAR